MNRTPLRLFLIAVVLGLAGCGGVPRITDTTTPWTAADTAREFTVDLDVPEDRFSVLDLSLRFTRHFWPGAAQANPLPATPPAAASGSFSAAPPRADTFPDSHTVFYRWVARLRGTTAGATPFTIMTPLKRFVVGCPRILTDAQLIVAMANHVGRFTTATPHRLAWRTGAGYPILPHRRSVMTGNGFTLSNLPVNLLQGYLNLGPDLFRDDPRLNRPSLLFYAGRPQAAGETRGDYLADMTDAESDNDPYSFIGVAYTKLYDPDNRPVMGCIPSDAWFVHEAGYHIDTGQMFMTPPAEARPGAQNMLLRPAGARPGGAFLWHPRLWDLHVWIDPAGGAPILNIFDPSSYADPRDPNETPNLRDSAVQGMTLPPRAFFRPETFE